MVKAIFWRSERFVALRCVNFICTDKNGCGKSYLLDLPVCAILGCSCLQRRSSGEIFRITQYSELPRLTLLHRSPVLYCCSLLIAQAPPSFRVMRKVNNRSETRAYFGNLTESRLCERSSLQVWPWPGGLSVCAVRTPLCAYQCFARLYWVLDGDCMRIIWEFDWRQFPNSQDLITSDCCMCKIPSNLPPVSRWFDNRVCPTIEAIDVLKSPLSLVPRLSMGGERQSLVSTVCAILGNRNVLYPYNHDDITYTYRYIVCTLSD